MLPGAYCRGPPAPTLDHPLTDGCERAYTRASSAPLAPVFQECVEDRTGSIRSLGK